MLQEKLPIVPLLTLLVWIASDIERLKGCDQDPGVFLRVLAGDDLGIVTEEAAEGRVRLFSQAAAVTHEQYLAKLFDIGQLT